jgi:hypothetical protein
MTVAVHEVEICIRICSEEGRVRACMLMPNPLLLVVGAQARMTTANLSTLGYQRSGSIISSKREGEDDDENIG